MKKRLCALALTVLMALSVTPLVRAADLPFTDVKATSWYYNDVVRAYESGLINGKTATAFGPGDNMTYAEAVKLAACMRQLFTEGSVSLENGSPWYQPYADYCKENGVITKDYSWKDPATRAGYAEIFAKALPELTAKNTVADNAIPDVKTTHPQAGAIYALYRAGVAEGSTVNGAAHCFSPNDPIKRSEVAAILTRMMDPQARKDLNMPTAYVAPAKPVKPVSLALKYDGGGADSKWYVEEATVGAPVCVDVDKNGKLDLIYSGRSVFCLDAATGKVNWRVPSGTDRAGKGTSDGGRLVSDIRVLDVDGDGRNEIVTVHTNFGKGQSVIAVYNDQGYFESGWPVTTDYPVRTLEVENLEGDGWCEILAGLGVGAAGAEPTNAPSLYIFEPDGSQRPGWPQNSGYGFYGNTLGAADLNGDGKKEVVALYDGEHTRAWDMWGKPVAASGEAYAGLLWNNLPVTEDYAHEMVCVDWARNHGGKVAANGDHILGPTRQESYCIVGTTGGVVPADLDGNGTTELVYTCGMVDGNLLMRNNVNSYEGVLKYYTTFILNTDRTRYKNAALGVDWTQMPTDPAPIVSMDSNVIPAADMKPVAADLNGDGQKEILYAANDGQLHCWSLDKTQKNSWPVTFSTPGSTVKEFASRPAVADVNGDGYLEVIVGTYTQTGQTAKRGSLYVLDYQGKVLAQAVLPVTYGHNADSGSANGCQATPCVADLDGDGKKEIALTTLFSGLMVYDVNP